MGIGLVVDEGSIFVEKEVTEGTYVPESASEKAIEVLSDGIEFKPAKELIERNTRTGTIESVAGRVGQKSMTGTIPTEFKAGNGEGVLPETIALYEALLGGKTEITETISTVGHTVSKIYMDGADVLKYKVGNIVKIKESANALVDHISPIIALGADFIELLIPYDVPFTDAVVVGASTQIFYQSGQPTLSVTNYQGGKIREKAIGMRCVSGELSDFATGLLPKFTFGLEGLNYDKEVGQPLFDPTYDSEAGVEAPIVLCSKIYRDATELIVNSVGISVANTLGFLTSTASCSGKISSRITKLNVNFTIDPYMEDDNVDNFNFFDQNTPFSIFGSASNKGANDYALVQSVAYSMPNCRIPEISTADADGIITESINGSAHKTEGNDTLFIAFL